jgi:hypothetical protein
VENENKEAVALWAEKLLTEVRGFEPSLFQPKGEIKASRVLGDCPESAKRFFSLALFYERECKRIKLEGEFQEGGMAGDDKVRFYQMDQKYDTLMEMFWGEVHEHLNTWGIPIGVRVGWRIVEVKDENPLQRILGGVIQLPLP